MSKTPKKLKNKTLSEKISESFIPKPLADPERDSEDETAAKLADVDDPDVVVNNKLSDFRKRNVKLLSEYGEKYCGKIASRKDFEEESFTEGSDEELEESSEDEDALEEYKKKLKSDGTAQYKRKRDSSDDEEVDEDDLLEAENDSDYKSDDVEDELDGDDEEDEDEQDDEQKSEDDEDEQDDGEDSEDNEETLSKDDATNLVSKVDDKKEVQKGFAVQCQLKVWEKLLEIRIHSQKYMSRGNSLPDPKTLPELCEADNDLNSLRKETQLNLCGLLDDMLELKHCLLKQNSDTKSLVKDFRKRPANTEDDEPPVKLYAEALKENMDNFRPLRNSVLLKWNDRTRILTPGANAKRSRNLGENFDILKKIDAALLNKNELIKKSRIVKGGNTSKEDESKTQEENQNGLHENEENGVENEPNYNVEVYDDTDFYHQQLRELIEFKASTSATPAEMSKQFAELQKLRHKMKKKVDTRASKGRKIRYVVHKKLVNFMAPNPYSSWTEESKTELYRSLFGS